MANLMLHCGAESVDRNDPVLLQMPDKMGARHNPIPHIQFIEAIERSVRSHGLAINDAVFGALKDGKRMFGLMEVGNEETYSNVIGFRASHDQSLPLGIVAGSQVFVCDNLAFCGEVRIKTKQTTNLPQRLPGLVDDAIRKTGTMIETQRDRFGVYRATHLTDSEADAAITSMVRDGAVTGSRVGHVINEWDNPSHDEFTKDGRTLWRLYNAVTDSYKPKDEEARTNMAWLPKRSRKLTLLCDDMADFKAAA